ncbi:MazG nucleotide pyrophosphohydrolase domain-containing protein [Microlunatus soli]|uniref:NTP pyrophosphatase, house-cleaning of non-canonical NTPs n=1 Tax=Microlunatus soli TaxID=630515 RepID=A0A1H2AEZ1_9ACTN|nr:MazG nucleotide pyrophosphohydrolase domain-containing protein [Microlunatus soli]SDT44322.1 NTP pyrophosphatase, house-cleaning of non-canonical NTPs [Microlunatus soli]
MELQALQEAARTIRSRYARYEERQYGRSWTPEEIMLGFVGDVGDLAKLTQSAAGVRGSAEVQDKLAHELADCLWSVLTLADCYRIDLESAFGATMAEIDRWLEQHEA